MNRRTAGESADVRQRRLAKAKEWRQQNPEQSKRRVNEWNAKNREHVRQRESKKRFKRKLEVIKAYGGKCVCCGENHPSFLTLDHINNGGAKHRKQVFSLSKGGSFWWWAKKENYPSILQLLCFNCNCGRQVNKGICPHNKEVMDLWYTNSDGNNKGIISGLWTT
jgi:hypothetical protein